MQNKYKIKVGEYYIYKSTIKFILEQTKSKKTDLIKFIEQAIAIKAQMPCVVNSCAYKSRKQGWGYYDYAILLGTLYDLSTIYEMEYPSRRILPGVELMGIFIKDEKAWQRVKEWGLRYL